MKKYYARYKGEMIIEAESEEDAMRQAWLSKNLDVAAISDMMIEEKEE